jgi:hypothetical protein
MEQRLVCEVEGERAGPEAVECCGRPFRSWELLKS